MGVSKTVGLERVWEGLRVRRLWVTVAGGIRSPGPGGVRQGRWLQECLEYSPDPGHDSWRPVLAGMVGRVQRIAIMTRRSVVYGWLRGSGKHWRRVGLAAVGAVLLGCASTETARKEPTLRQDFIEYRQLVALAMTQVGATLSALDEVAVQASGDPRRAYGAFAKAVHRLEVDSIKVRSRTQAMRARGDAYFEHWVEYLAGVKNEEVRRRAEEHRAELKRSFDGIQEASQQVREVFRPLLSDLQKLRAVLEAEPTLVRIDAQKSLILAAKDKGRQVQQGLDRILAEMNGITALLRPAGGPVKE